MPWIFDRWLEHTKSAASGCCRATIGGDVSGRLSEVLKASKYIYICAHVSIYICMYRFANKRMIGFKKTCQFLQEISVLPVVCIDFFMVTLK